MAIFYKRDDVAISFVHGDAAGLEARLGNDDFWSPCLAAIHATLGAYIALAPSGDDRAFHGNHNVAKPLALENLLEVHVGFFEVWLQRALHFAG